MISGLPFDDIRQLLNSLPAPDGAAAEGARARGERLAASGLPMGRADAIAAWLAATTGMAAPPLARGTVALFVGTHGLAAGDAPERPAGFERRFVEHVAAGGAPVCQPCASNGLGLRVFDLALDLPVADITVEAALSERDCAATMAFGMEAVAGGTDLLCLGGIGAGGEIAAAALLTALLGGAPEDWLAPAADELRAQRADAAGRALALHTSVRKDPLEALRRLGGREFAAIAGAVLAARSERVPVILDGIAALAAAAVMRAAAPGALSHCIAADRGPEPCGEAARRLGLDTLLDLGLATGDGAAGALAAGLLRDLARVHGQSVPLPP